MKLGFNRYVALAHTAFEYDGSYRQFWVDTVENKIVFQERNKNDSWDSKYFNGNSKLSIGILPILMLHVGKLPIFMHASFVWMMLLFVLSFLATELAYLEQ